jgi:catechol 2,3-dioxygenase-like lactoylglutathione lyase family enzyme
MSNHRDIPADWLAEFEAASKRTLEERFRYSFIKTYKPVMDDAPYRSFDTMADYRKWCEENLPDWLGYGRVKSMVTPNLLVLRCRDLERSRAFYQLFDLAFSAHAHGKGPTHYAHETPDFVLELYPAPSSDYTDQTAIGFAVDDLAALHAQLISAGLNPGAISKESWGTTFVIRDPDGRRVELKQR